MIVVAYIGLIASVIFLIVNLFRDIFRVNNMIFNLFAVTAGFIQLFTLTAIVVASLVDLKYLCLAAEIAYFASSYLENNEQSKKLKDSPEHQGILGRYKKSDPPNTIKDYFLSYLTLVLSLLPFVFFLLTLPTK